MIRLTLTRLSSEDHGIFGKLEIQSGPIGLVTLENHLKAIPTGVYSLSWHESGHLYGATVPLLNNVPGRTYILIHWGNFETCSEGCILAGMCRDGNAIDSSKTAVQKIVTYLKTVDPDLEDTQIQIQ